MILQILVYRKKKKKKMAKYLQWKIMCRGHDCKEVLYKPIPHSVKVKDELN